MNMNIYFFIDYIENESKVKKNSQKYQSERAKTKNAKKNSNIHFDHIKKEKMSDLQLTESMYPPGWDVKYDSKTGKW